MLHRLINWINVEGVENGGKDHFVPTKMAYENYQASNGPKEIWIAPLAGHALSYPMYKTEYRKQIKAFLDKYVH